MSWIDDNIDRLTDEDDSAYTRSCSRCGAFELHWEEARGDHNRKRWVLMEADGSIHCCSDTWSAATPSDFPVVNT
jgi:hypothetical protein